MWKNRSAGSRPRRLVLEPLEQRALLDAGAAQLDAGAAQLDAGAAQLDAGAAQLDAGAAQLDAGAAQLDAGAAQLAQFVTMPYLQNVTPRSMVIMWEMDATEAVTVEYGLSNAYGSSAPGVSQPSGFSGTHIYKAQLDGLLPESRYHYRLTGGGAPLTGDRLFTTGTDNEIDFAFGAFADTQGTNHGAWTADPLQPTSAMMAHMAQSGVDFGFGVGDLAESGGSYYDTRNYYLDRVAKYLGQTAPWFNAWGNHDSGSRNAVLRRFADMPSKDRPGYSPGFGSFHFTYANSLFIAIDYYDAGVITSGWLESLLQSPLNQNARFTVVGIHVPPYCELWVDGDSSLRTYLVPLLEQYGVDLVISGHTHEYERGFLNGVYYVVTGGGSWLDFPESLVRDWPHMTVGGYHNVPGTWARESSPGVLGPPQPIRGGLVNQYVRFQITGNHLQAEMHGFNADGSYVGVLDSFSFGDTPGVNDPPAFSFSPLTKPPAPAWSEYHDSLAGDARDPDANEVLSFSKVAGPEWLDVAADGTLSGMPSAPDAGENQFTVRVTDSGGLFDEAVLEILVEPGSAAVLGRYLFYNNSAFDTGPGKSDDHAVAPDKTALRSGETATFAHYTSYDRGINGIMVDVAGPAGMPSVNDLRFRVGNDDDPAGWAAAPQPRGFTVRAGAGTAGSHRVTITWEDGAIRRQWLQVTVLATAATGLGKNDVFYFGNAVGEAGNSSTDAKVNAIDMLGARDNQRGLLNPAPIDFRYDFNRDARVNATDMLIARNNQTHFLNALKLWARQPAVLITEVGTADEDYVEIQNLGDTAVDTSGWFVVANDAYDAEHPPDVNAWHKTLWQLPDLMEVGLVLYRTDDQHDPEHYWGEGIFWRTAASGWVMLVDDRGRLIDFVVWGYRPEEIASLAIDVGEFRLTAAGVFNGDSIPSEADDWDNSLQRRGSSDHDSAADWDFVLPMSKGRRNADLTTPFPTGGAPG